MDNLKREYRYQFTKERWRRFFLSPLWLGLPAVVILSFIIMMIIGTLGDLEYRYTLSLSAREILAISICYLLGVFVATCQTPEMMKQEQERDRQEAMEQYHKTKRWQAILISIVGIILCLAFLVGVFIIPDYVAQRREGVASAEIVINMVGSALSGLVVVAMQIVERLRG